MCDYAQGQLILAHDELDQDGEDLVEDIRLGHVEHVSLLVGLRDRLEKNDVKTTLPLRVYLLEVPSGQEIWKSNFLHLQYRMMGAARGAAPTVPSHALMIVPNSYLTLEGYVPSADHASYKKMLLLGAGSTGAGVRVAVVDSGIEAAAHAAHRITDLVGTKGEDRVGHGTAVSNVIHDVAPGANVVIVKVTDNPRFVEFDALAGLEAAASQADVVNLSMGFGSADRECDKCGRQSISSRSMVFESIVGLALAKPHQPIIVAAAGNQSRRELRYPARFGNVVAVGALDASGKRASYTNYWARDAAGDPHPNLFFAPGGEATRPVGSTVSPLPTAAQFGTSLATAYASGVVACARARHGGNRAALLTALRNAASLFPGHVPAEDGNGLIQDA